MPLKLKKPRMEQAPAKRIIMDRLYGIFFGFIGNFFFILIYSPRKYWKQDFIPNENDYQYG